MPISGSGWELHVQRTKEQTRPKGKVRTRTVGRYQVFHDGVAQPGADMSGTTAETKGPGDNSKLNNGLRIEAGRYPLKTSGGPKYLTIGYSTSANQNVKTKPGIELTKTNKRTDIIVHPGTGFLSSIGCINPCTSLPNEKEMITFSTSRRRVISLIDDLKMFVGASFPNSNDKPIPKAFVVIDGEP